MSTILNFILIFNMTFSDYDLFCLRVLEIMILSYIPINTFVRGLLIRLRLQHKYD
jgi:hypothetical protein